MNQISNSNEYSFNRGLGTVEAASLQRKMWTKTFGWMMMAMLVSALSAYITINTAAFNFFLSSTGLIVAIILELALVIAISGAINRISSRAAFFLFMLYSLINGVTLSVILMMYTASTVTLAFLVTGGMFGVMALIGATTKVDLSKYGSIFMMLLVGLIIASVVNIFLKSPAVYWISSYIGVALFCGLTAFDVYRYKQIYESQVLDEENANKVAVMAALSLYLDFINLFLYLLRIFGRRD